MSDLLAVIDEYRVLVGALATTLILAIIIHKWWSQVKLFYKSVWYGLPVIGKVARLGRDTAVEGTWFRSERVLCDDFYGDMTNIAADPDIYDHSRRYLMKVHELGRNELGMVMWLLVIAMVFVEALGFAYILSGYTLPGASEKLQVQGAVGIAFLISAVLVWLTHQAGNETHRRGLIRKARVWWLHDDRTTRPNLVPNNRVSLEHNAADDDSPDYIQLINRLDTNASVTPGVPWWGVLCATAILVVAVGATVVRYNAYLEAKGHETVGDTRTDTFDLGMNLPDLITAPQEGANDQARQEMDAADRMANLWTFGLLAFLFVLIQIMGVGIGYKTGFAGKESKLARRTVGSFKTRDEYEAWYDRRRSAIVGLAQKHLTRLHARLAATASANGIDNRLRSALDGASHRTFETYADQRAEEAAQRRARDNRDRDRKRRMPVHAPPEERRQDARSAAEPPGPPLDEDAIRNEVRAQIMAEQAAEAAATRAVETEAEMRERLRRELMAELQDGRPSEARP
jgi:hypothetical protein